MPMSKTMILGLCLTILIGYIGGFVLMVVDGTRRLLATDRAWTPRRRFQDDDTPNVDPLGWP